MIVPLYLSTTNLTDGNFVTIFRRLAQPSPFRRIYICGFTSNYITALFPEWHGEEIRLLGNEGVKKPSMKEEPLASATEKDLLIAAYVKAELCVGGEGALRFPGKQLYVNNEPGDAIYSFPQDPSLPPPPDFARRSPYGTTQTESIESYLPPVDRAYVIGHLEDSNRTVRVPIGIQYLLLSMPPSRREKIFNHIHRPKNNGKHFAIYLAKHCIPFRDTAAKLIAQIGELHIGKEYQKCIDKFPDPPGSKPQMSIAPRGDLKIHDSVWMSNENVFYSYRYALVMENTYRDGYISEKLIIAFLSGSIPIWYGTKEVFEIFNRNAFIYFDVENPEPALQKIRELEADPAAYKEMLVEPILVNGERTIEEYFSLENGIGGGKLKNKIRMMMGLKNGEALE